MVEYTFQVKTQGTDFAYRGWRIVSKVRAQGTDFAYLDRTVNKMVNQSSYRLKVHGPESVSVKTTAVYRV